MNVKISEFAKDFINVLSKWSSEMYTEEHDGALYLKDPDSIWKQEGKIVYLGDRDDELRNLRDNITKAEWKEIKDKAGAWNWITDPEALKYVVTKEDGTLNEFCKIGIIQPDDEIRFVPEIWDENYGVVRPAEWWTKKAIIKAFEESKDICVKIL